MDFNYKEFEMPKRVEFERETFTETYGKLIVEPLERGYGTTLGNSLRRVLLSSIEGAAVYAVRIKGVLHEISSIPGVKEDVIDILLNIKKVRMKYLTQEGRKVASIKIKGPAEVYAKDIITDGTYEILNKDQYICSLDQNAEIEMYLYLTKGRGYIPSESIKDEDLPIDAMTIDAIFSPVKKVNFRVEKTRVGESTDYDKLIIELWTDGSITPEKAISEASDILIRHFNILRFSVSTKDYLEDKRDSEYEIEKAFIYDKINENVFKPIEDLELSVRAYNCLNNAGINLIAELIQKTEDELLKTKNFGKRSLQEIKEVLNRQGLKLGMRLNPELFEKLNEKAPRG